MYGTAQRGAGQCDAALFIQPTAVRRTRKRVSASHCEKVFQSIWNVRNMGGSVLVGWSCFSARTIGCLRWEEEMD